MKREQLKTPCYVVREKAIENNCRILQKLKTESGCKILLAQKCFSLYALYPLIAKYLDGTEASGLFEARLGYEHMQGKENHVFSAAFSQAEFNEVVKYSDHVVFNSINQLEAFYDQARAAKMSVGLRINPECSTAEHEIYDPCAKGSRLGVTRFAIDASKKAVFSKLDGLHFHTLCEQGSDALKVTLDAVEKNFGDVLSKLKWINFGGGHHITKDNYDLELLKSCIKRMQDKYGLTVYLEPGEAVALNAGELITTVLDVQPDYAKTGELPCAIIDASAACHMPDVLEMPYRPPLFNSGLPNEKEFTYRLGSKTCLAGDIVGDYSFDKPLNIGDRLVFGDMAIYTMVKNNTFNGMPLPSIVLERSDESYELLRCFGYTDFVSRL